MALLSKADVARKSNVKAGRQIKHHSKNKLAPFNYLDSVKIEETEGNS